ncbi:MAG: transglutaminase domain-containing protein [Chitinophagales bacterium]
MHQHRFALIVVLIVLISFARIPQVNASENWTISVEQRNIATTVAPRMENGRLLVPVRLVYESIGCQVLWNPLSKTATILKGTDIMRLTVDKSQVGWNGTIFTLESPPRMIKGQLLVPAGMALEKLGANLEWDLTNHRLYMNTRAETIKKAQLNNPAHYLLEKKWRFSNRGDPATLKVELNLGNSSSPYQRELELKVNPQPESISVDDYGNRKAVIVFNNLGKNKTADVTVEREVINSAINYNIEPNLVNSDYSRFSAFDLYVRQQPMIEVGDSTVQITAKNLRQNLANSNSPYDLAKEIYQFVNLHMTYDDNEAVRNKGAVSALRNGKGVCGDYASLFVALCRASGIPARMVYGYWIEDMKTSVNQWVEISKYRHAWAEFNLPQYGWVVTEPTYIFMVNDNQEVNWDYFGGLKKSGHLVTGYYSGFREDVTWTVRGRGNLKVDLEPVSERVMVVKQDERS